MTDREGELGDQLVGEKKKGAAMKMYMLKYSVNCPLLFPLLQPTLASVPLHVVCRDP